MGLVDLMRQVGPMLAGTGGDGEGHLSLIRRLARSKIRDRPYQTPPFLLNEQEIPSGDINAPNVPREWAELGDEPLSRPLTPDRMSGVASASSFPSLVEREPDRTLARPDFGLEFGSGQTPEEKRAYAELQRRAHGPMAGDAPAPPTAIDSMLRRRAAEPLATDTSVPETALAMRSTMSPLPAPVTPALPGLLYDPGGRPLKPDYSKLAPDAALMRREEYIRALEQYKPVNRNSRIKSGLISAGRGALAGLREGPGGAIGGALTGAGFGLLDPATDERYAKRRDLGEARMEMAGDLDFRKKTSDLANEVVERGLKRAQTERALNPRYKPDVEMGSDGYLMTIDGSIASPVTDAKGNRIRGKRDAKHEWRNDPFSGKAELWEVTPGETDKKLSAVDAHRDLVKTAQGWVLPGTALMADATAENRNYQRTVAEQNKAQTTAERNEDIARGRGDKDQARREKAAGIARELEAAKGDAIKWLNMANVEKDPKVKTYYESLAAAEKQKALAFAIQIDQGFGDIYEAGPGEGGWPYAKPRAAAAAPALSPRSGKIQPSEDPDVRAYANQYFKGDYQAAQEAIRKQKQK